MITFAKANLNDQAGMERAFIDYVNQVHDAHDGSFNGMLNASLLSCDYATRSVTLAVDTKSWMANPNDVVHGGITASVMDLTMGLLSRYFSGGGLTPTVNMSVNYLLPVPLGECVVVRARISMNGFHVCAVTGEAFLKGAEDALVATASAIYYVNHSRV